MKLIASNYDNLSQQVLFSVKADVEAIKKFTDKGNKFVFASSNNYEKASNNLEKMDLCPSYTSILNGIVLFDNNRNVVSAKYISKYEKSDFAYFLNKRIAFLNEYGNLSNHDTVEMIINTDSIKDLRDIKKLIEYFDKYDIFNYFDSTTISVRKKSNKVDSINLLKKIRNLDDKDIYTTGDSINDKEMLETYNGFRMLSANPRLYKSGKGTITSVKNLIKKIEK